MDDKATPGVDIPGVSVDVTGTANESDEAEIEPTNVERTAGTMNLRRQPRKEYNRKNYDNVSNITDETQKDGIILMQLDYEENSGTFNVTEDKFDEVEAEYMFLIELLRWKEDIHGIKDTTSDADPNDVTKLPECFFLD